MNVISSKFGSVWRKWDLHFHTPSSFDYADKSVTNEHLVNGLIAAGIEVVAITDHNVIDVSRIKELQALAGDRLTVLPGIEFRSELGGSDSVHFIGIFPEDCPIEDIWTKLSGKLEITPTDVIRKGGEQCIYCDLSDTAAIVCDLGGLISVHAGSKSNSLEGIKSANLINQKMKLQLVRECIDIFEVGAVKDIAMYREKIFPHFDYPVPLIACSDNHDIKNYPDDGFFWLKGDRCFEALRQALYEPEYRVQVGKYRPLEPLLRIEKIAINFPADTQLRSKTGSHPFCFRGGRNINLSPYFTCIVGGRGTGKSTLLNLINEKLFPGSNSFFQENRIVSNPSMTIDSAVVIDDDQDQIEIEFLQQNEIEQFAVDPSRFTEAIFKRLKKLDSSNELSLIENNVNDEIDKLHAHATRLAESFELQDKIEQSKRELHTNKRLVDSFQTPEYKKLAEDLGEFAKGSQHLRSGEERLRTFISSVRGALGSRLPRDGARPIVHDDIIKKATDSIRKILDDAENSPEVVESRELVAEIAALIENSRRSLVDYLKDRGLSPENLADVEKASGLIAKLEEEIPEDERLLADLSRQIDEFDPSNDFSNEYKRTIERLLAPINEKLAIQSAEVRPIRLEYEFDTGAAKASIENLIVESIVTADERKLRSDHVSSSLESLDFELEPSREDILKGIKVDSKTGQLLHDFFSHERNYLIFLQGIREYFVSISDFRRIKVYYDDKPIESSSFGQRCTAAIVVLVLLGNTPIIIDEPEAHLDSSLIAKYLVTLIKEKKQERQIIFATHNANFVINGDAELIHVLEMDSDNLSIVNSTTIENLKYRQRLLALEGGQAAFLQRENRYGI